MSPVGQHQRFFLVAEGPGVFAGDASQPLGMGRGNGPAPNFGEGVRQGAGRPAGLVQLGDVMGLHLLGVETRGQRPGQQLKKHLQGGDTHAEVGGLNNGEF